MTTQRAKRKLSAILSADVKGYSRLMGEDELATVRTLEAYREMITEVIRNYSGRVVDSPGDNLLAEFTSVVDAVESAVEIQQELKAKNAELPENRRMQFRIGINLGDVIEEGERIYGDGVNVAARLEGLAEGGGVCISGTAFDQIEGKLGLEFEYLGEQAVKNIKKPIRVYRVKRERGVSDVEISRELPLPDKPSIAVLPFVNMSDDPKQEYFSDGVAEEIITALSKVPEMFVIARNSTFIYKGKSVKVQQVGRELGVRYVLEGSVRKAGERVRITAQLIDTKTQHHLWAERYDRDLKDVFALQDEITMKILLALQIKLTEGEQARLESKTTDNMEAYLKFLQGRSYAYHWNREDSFIAKQISEEVINLEPKFAPAYTLLGHIHLMHIWFGWSKSPVQSFQQARDLAQKALELDESLPHAHALLGHIYALMRQHEKAIEEAEKALALAPNSAEWHVWLGGALFYGGRPEEAISAINKAIRLNPYPSSWYLMNLGHAYRGSGRYEEAVQAYKKALRIEPMNLFARTGLVATYILLGYEEQARVEATKVLRLSPEFSLESFGKTLPFKNQADTDSYIDALRKAGLN